MQDYEELNPSPDKRLLLLQDLYFTILGANRQHNIASFN